MLGHVAARPGCLPLISMGVSPCLSIDIYISVNHRPGPVILHPRCTYPSKLLCFFSAVTGSECDYYTAVSIGRPRRLFYFYIFQKKNLQKYILVFKIYSSIPLPPGRGAAGGLPPPCWAVGTSLQIKIKFIYEQILGGGLPPPCRAAGPLPPSGGAAGTCT